jgi:hypothetical protein
MILKELDPFTSSDPLAKAGRKAEEQMTHYLRRAFQDNETFQVFNGIRFEKNGDAAQIDHLILHRFGIVLVESKSVSSRVRVNEHLEWSRQWNGRWQGMASPVKQAERQGAFLREYLQDHRESLRNRYLLGTRQGGFLNMNLDIVVAISDSGIIDRPKKIELPEVCKADQAVDRIQTIFRRHQKADSLFNFSAKEGGYSFASDERDRVVAFLLARHVPGREATSTVVVAGTSSVSLEPLPRTRPVTPAESDVPEEKKAAQAASVCRHCGSDRLLVNYGQYGYYFKCSSCEGNTPIRLTCPVCGGKLRVRKQGRQFFSGCASCGTEKLFHVNSEEAVVNT